MHYPKVSAIIPVSCSSSNSLAVRVQNVLNQLYPNFEVIVVGNTSSAGIPDILNQFHDPRIKHFDYDKDSDRSAIIRAGIQASTGEFITIVDNNDTFHPERLQIHVSFLEGHADIDATCNTRIETDAVGLHQCLWQPPLHITLSELVLGLPLSTSDLILRRAAANITGGNQATTGNEQSLNTNVNFIYHLALAGCRFAGLDRALSFHQHDAGCFSEDISCEITSAIQALESVFSDPRCPQEVKALRVKALAQVHLHGSFCAFVQNTTTLGQELIRKSIRFDRSILDSEANAYLEFLVLRSLQYSSEYEPLLQRVFAQLPPELAWIHKFYHRAVALGCLYRNVHHILWGRLEQGQTRPTNGAVQYMRLTRRVQHYLLGQLLAYEAEFGPASTELVLRNLTRCLRELGAGADMQRFQGAYFKERAFRNYRQARYSAVPANTYKAVVSNPTLMANRGIWSILVRSLVHLPQH